MNSPVTYYGGKSYMTDILQSYFPANYKLYVEGFGGGASLLLNKPATDLEIYNDIEKNVYSLFKVISNEELLKQLQFMLELTPYSHDLRKEYGEDLKTANLSILERAYRFFYVCRSSFNGVGSFTANLVVRRTMAKSVSDYLSAIAGLTQVHERLRNVIIENRDIFDLLDKYDAEDTFFYLDPPYVQETRRSSQKYRHEMEDDLHVKLVDRLLTIKGKVLVSGYDHPIYDKLVENGWHKYNFTPPNTKTPAVETLWCNYDIESDKNLF